MDADVAVVIVTYGDRELILSSVLSDVIGHDRRIRKIYVVNNGAKFNVKECCKKISSSAIDVIDVGFNSGSANGFKIGLMSAVNSGHEYIWILDDDNCPKKDALNYLLCSKDIFGVANDDVFVSFRESRKEYNDILCGIKKVDNINSFLNFGILDFRNSFNKILKKFGVKSVQNGSQIYSVASIGRAPYGGMLISSNLIKKIGYPNSEMVLYSDDHEFSERILNSGGRIYLIGPSRLVEMEESWDRGIGGGHQFYNIKSPEFKIYYSVRNRVYLDWSRVECRYCFFANMIVYLIFAALISVRNKSFFSVFVKRTKLLFLAISDGINGKLGNRFNI